jgi:hypothetical protein
MIILPYAYNYNILYITSKDNFEIVGKKTDWLETLGLDGHSNKFSWLHYYLPYVPENALAEASNSENLTDTDIK